MVRSAIVLLRNEAGPVGGGGGGDECRITLELRQQFDDVRVVSATLEYVFLPVGFLQGHLLKRPNPHFYEVADEISQELQDLSVAFCDARGRATRISHPALVNEPPAVKGGGMLQV